MLLALSVGVLVDSAGAQDPGLSLDGALRYPDGTVQGSARPGVAPVVDSGQTTCWDATGTERNCAGTGEDGEHRAGLSYATPRFTDNGDGTVTDHQTGLMWMKDADCGWGNRTWQDALETATDFNAGSGSAGGDCDEYNDVSPPHTDWRLPSLLEMRSLVDFGAANPALDPVHPFLGVSAGEHWTSTTYALSLRAAWTLEPGFGLNLVSNKGNPRRVWLVRGEPLLPAPATSGAALTLADGGIEYSDGSLQTSAAVDSAPLRASGWATCFAANGQPRPCPGTGEDGEFSYGVAAPSPRFTDRGDGTVVDELTGLVWLKDANCPAANKTWQQALDWVDDLNTMSIGCSGYAAGSHSDWRLPNARELLSLNDLTASEPALTPGHPFVNVFSQTDEHYWTSTTSLDASKTWAIATDMSDGLQRRKLKTDIGCCWVWPVRGGQ